jgi:Secretion system C-terminal sorting domain
MKLKLFTYLLFSTVLLVFFSSTKINPNNPPVGRTGAPGETTCQASGCHSGGAFIGTVEITGLPDTVVANQAYSITLTNTSNAVKSGFQLTVLNEANQKAGTLTAGTGCSIGNGGGRQYVRQSSPRTLTNGSTSWNFTWTAPASVVGDSIHFYFASLCANGTGNVNGDNAIKGSKSVVLPSPVSGLDDVAQQANLKIFPNPAMSNLTIVVPGKGEVSILNAIGQSVLKANVNNLQKVDISKLEVGLYFVKFESNGKVQTEIFVKK